MKPEFEKIQQKSSRSFSVRVIKRRNRPLLTKAWHYHPEIEICYTLKSKGRRYVGNNISEYKEHDLVILGSNLPHGFTTLDESEQYVIQFKKEFLGQDFFNSMELAQINQLLKKSKRGLAYEGQQIEKIGKTIKKLSTFKRSSFNQLLSLLKLLQSLSHNQYFVPICTEKYSSQISINKLNSVKSIFQFIEKNFQKEITIKDACKIVNLTESAFYKFMKRHSNKKFTTILNEYRTDHAFKLLASSDIPISEISYQSGYRNLSHFNRIFKQTYNMTPRQLRRKYDTVLELV